MNRFLPYHVHAAILLCMLLLSTRVSAQRESHTLNDGWRFRQGDIAAAADPAFDDSEWLPVHLPHTWNTDAYSEKNYYRGAGWYRRSMRLPQSWRNRRIVLKVDAASKAATLFVNGHEVGSHAGGYTAFAYDITSYVDFDADNTLALMVDNSREDIPPVSGDFTFFGGIYRDVWLTALPACHFGSDDNSTDGIMVSTPCVCAEKGRIAVRGRVGNSASEKKSLVVLCAIYDPDGECLQTLRRRIALPAGGTADFDFESDVISSPQLWTPETPCLYRVDTELKEVSSGEIIDRASHVAGFRWFGFDGRQGFFLNGRPYKLHGICRHQDQKPVGVAMSDEMHRRDFRLMKDMGANFIRISHYPQDDALLELCDREGMLVWEEIPVIDIVPDTPGYGDNCEVSLREMIRQHYNHPSIIMWGYMNEIMLVTQRIYGSSSEFGAVAGRTLELARRLEHVVKTEDPARASVMAFHGSDIYNETGLGDVVDVVGWNLYSGWYGGDLTEFERFLERQQNAYPDHPVIVSEYGAGSDRRLHSENPRPFDFSIEYQQRFLEHYLPVIERLPYVCGGAHWNFIDFSSALRDESMPRVNNKGLVDTERRPKDVYFYYQAAWRQDIPVLHIASGDRVWRSGVRRGSEQVVQPVKVYANLPEVELFVDGVSLGTKRVENFHAVFEVPLRDGSRYISARGLFHGQEIHDGLRVNFTSLPSSLRDEELGSRELAVNVGSDCFYTSDRSQLTWLPDRAYESGGWGYIGGEPKSTQTEIELTDDGPLFQTMREGVEGYRFDLTPGAYEVELLFTDIYRPTESVAYMLGKGGEESSSAGNSFSIGINGEIVEPDFSPSRDNGCFRAIRRRYPVFVDGDSIEIRFESLHGKRFLSGIKLRRL